MKSPIVKYLLGESASAGVAGADRWNEDDKSGGRTSPAFDAGDRDEQDEDEADER